MKKVVIFGATGMTGLCTVEAAIKKGLTTRIFVRDESKVPKEIKDKVEIVVGDVLNEAQVNTAIKDVDGVVVVLGTRNDLKPTTDMSTGMKNIIAGMKANNVNTVSVCLSAFLFYEPEKVPKMFVDVNADHQRMYDALKDSALKYIAVFPPHIGDAPSSKFTTEFDKSPGRMISKWDLGIFLIDSLTQTEFHGRVVGLANTA
ncbi:flavin reductase (NADPH) [Arctopsyche grandis]|uniref:flavin reductase (NADPH) n=1 Tax=Arctopsyche grandis TaxID=121162 RepID=UPI00406D9671